MRVNLPETRTILRDDGPARNLAAAGPCNNEISVFGTQHLGTEEFPISDVLKRPKAVFSLREHPLWGKRDKSRGENDHKTKSIIPFGYHSGSGG